MPFELGVFIGAMRLGQADQRRKRCLIMDSQPYRYRQRISDLSGADIGSHHNEPKEIIGLVRDWLASCDTTHLLSGTGAIWKLFGEFQVALPAVCLEVRLVPGSLQFSEYVLLADEWLKAGPTRV